jgi:4'-phosphopantetheinyl transferase EntD
MPMNRAQRASAVEALFPATVVAFELHGAGSVRDMLPAEGQWVARAADKRRREFAAGRACARAALGTLGHEPAPLPMGPDRLPVWPAGVAGSITHTAHYALAVVGPDARLAALGVDAEEVAAVDPALWPRILRPEELERLRDLEEAARGERAAAMFSAKEAFYKCQYALTRRWLGFEEVIVEVSGDTFELSVIAPAHPIRRAPSPWIGRLTFRHGLVVAGIVAERARLPADLLACIDGGGRR